MSEHVSARQRFLRDLVLLLGVPGAAMAFLLIWWKPWQQLAEPYAAPGGDVFAAAAGTWDWEGAEGFCLRDPHTITFSADRQVMTLTSRESWTDSSGTVHQVTEYDVREHTAARIRGAIRGETRTTAQGEPVVWDLVLVDADTYRWHRTDWPLGSFTKPVRRCQTSAGGR